MAMRSILPNSWEVPETFRDRLGQEAGRQRSMFADGHLLIILHAPPILDNADREGRFFWRAPDGSWKSSGLGSNIGALRKHQAEFVERVEKLEKAEEHARRAEDFFNVIHEIAPLHRTIRNMHSALQQAREMVKEDKNIIACRDEAGGLERAGELLAVDAKNGLDYAMALKTEEQERQAHESTVAGHRLNMLAALFFPIATFASVFGMNLRNGLEDRAPWVFWLVLVAFMSMGWFLKMAIAQPSDAETARRP